MIRGAFSLLMVLPLFSFSSSWAQVSETRTSFDFQDHASLRLSNSQYVSSNTGFFRDDARSENTSLTLLLKKKSRLPLGFEGHFDIKNEYSATENWNYLNVFELYASKRVSGVDLSLGRKLELWSATDEEWKQGVVHSRYMQNRLTPEPAGLFGFFAGQDRETVSWSVGILPLYIPDIGAHFTVENGRFQSRNPWFDPPVDRFRFRGEDGEIRYSVNQPPVQEIALNPGFITTVESDVGRASSVRLTLAHKPVPQLLLGFPSLNKVFVGTNADYLQVDVTPQVIYHSVAALETWNQVGQWTLSSGVTVDAPIGAAFDESYTKQTYSPAWIYGFTASRPLEEEGRYAARLKFGVLKIQGGAAADRGVFAREKSLFERRFQYDEAYLAALHLPVRGWLRRPIDTETRLVYDRIQNGGTFAFAVGYTVAPRWRVDAEAEFLGLLGGDRQEKNGFLSTYRANDRVALGTSYVF